MTDTPLADTPVTDRALTDTPPPLSFTIVIPTFQRREMVCDAVRAIAKISYDGPFDLVVVVDGSTDGTAAALRQISASLPVPMQIIEQANGGLGHARNQGAAAATGEIVLFLDDDMICRPDILTRHAQSHAAGAEAVLGNIPLDPASPPGFLTEGIAVWAADSATDSQGDAPLTPFHMAGGHLSVRRAVFARLGGFDTSYTHGGNYGQEDADFGVRLLQHHDVRFNPDAVSYHRYIVSARENLERAYLSARADVKFARRHPGWTRALYALNHGGTKMTRLVYRPLARIPLLPKLLASAAALLAGAALKTPLRSNRHIARLYYGARQVFYWSGVRASGGLADETPLLVLCYHAIADHGDDAVLADYSIGPARFQTHLAALKKRGFSFVSADDVLAHYQRAAPLPPRPVLLTFDDCYTDLLDAARDILAPAGIPALAFCVTAMASGTNEWDQAIGTKKLGLLDIAGLGELERYGVALGCHSRSHRFMPDLDDDALYAETAGAAQDFTQMMGKRPRFFAYPYGGRDARSIGAVSQAGYDAAFGLADKTARLTDNLHDIPRVEMLASDTPWRFWLKTSFPRLSTFLRTRYFR